MKEETVLLLLWFVPMVILVSFAYYEVKKDKGTLEDFWGDGFLLICFIPFINMLCVFVASFLIVGHLITEKIEPWWGKVKNKKL